jgi:hypothetical protein
MRAILRQEVERAGQFNRGGEYRAAQIDHLIAEAGAPIEIVHPKSRYGRKERLTALPALLRRAKGFSNCDFAAIQQWLGCYAHYAAAIEESASPGVLLLQRTYRWPAFFAALDRKIPIVAVVDALVTLWPGETGFFHTAFTPFTLQSEIELLSSCAELYCISREEQWLLANHGVGSHYLPYFPPPERVEELLRIRKDRTDTAPREDEFLICVVFGNSDVRQSYEQQLDMLTRLYPNGGPIFHVTGYGSEEVRELYRPPLFQFHGVTDSAAWNALLRRVNAFCVHGSRGLGALTRVTDMLLSGIPVVSNAIAARSALGLAGVQVYDTAEELRAALERPFLMPPVPERPLACERQFVEHLRGLIA